jgi:GNAT superfamily N-acetyltransferase
MYDFPVNAPVLHELFDPFLPNSSALWAVLKGNYDGKALVDDISNPSQCVMRTNAALTYYSFQTEQLFLNEAIAHFRKTDQVWLVWPHQTDLHPPKVDFAEIVHRLEFYGYGANSETLRNLRRQLPDGFVIRRIDQQMFDGCEWRAEMEFYAGSLKHFLSYGIGICMLRGEEIVVEAYASSLGKTRAEIGAITHEKFRGHGYAPIACAFLIEACEKSGYQAYWSCDADHTASIRVARKLGFQNERPYLIYEYPSSK